MEALTKSQVDILTNSNKTIEPFTLAKRVLYAKVVDVYDGDTCKVNLFLYGNILKQFTIRMMGYDCPELRTKNLTEKKFGYRSKDIMVKLISDKIIKLECLDFDKYGRILGQIYIHDINHNEINVNKFMVDNHLGYNYMGDTKTTFESLLNSGYYRQEEVLVPITEDYRIIPIENIVEPREVIPVILETKTISPQPQPVEKKRKRWFCLFC